MRQQLAGGGGYDGSFVVFAGEGFDGVERIKARDRDEFGFVWKFATKQFGAEVTGDAVNAGEDFFAQEFFVDVRVFVGGVAVPEAGNHGASTGPAGSPAVAGRLRLPRTSRPLLNTADLRRRRVEEA